MAGGPWGGGGGDDGRGGNRGGSDDDGRRNPNGVNGGRRPGEGNQPVSEVDELLRKGQEQLRVLMGGRGRGNNGGGAPRGPQNGGLGPIFTKQGLFFGALAAVAAWSFMSFYTVRPEERSVELFLGEASGIGNPGLNFAPWPVVTYEKVQVTGERTTDIGAADGNSGELMLTRDQNVVDIGFQVVWNITDPQAYLFSLADPEETIRAVAESAMRDIIARSELSPILNRDRGAISSDLRIAVQSTLDSYNAGIQVIRVNLRRAQPPADVADAFRAVQSAQAERSRLENEADGYANRATAGARGEAARLTEEAEAYRANAVNSAEGEAARFNSVYAEYVKAPEITRRRLYLETMERVYAGMNKVILDGVSGGEGGQGVLPFLPLNELTRGSAATPAGSAAAAGGAN
ncbi:FtsH protease activity modulator HflK [Xinfangfangia sp. D13-10-4-6]|uniref:FtsH protease activity modulator HflK n=1 Tax=Pseudogemmobacter hezensis TaxID=2737662 RepID=UPI001557599B|nr:FtsH protease activity modulator HflK [Pseudogemmobacter hezensis]NPD13747.1 FtsH protease activity modulator HflK [Pseudogemmobacter hezensis]